ncbi:hypothetical protein DND13_07705 [Escherichia coli]|nr:hypothetical protein [Escherichia coli]EGE0033341.1 hypothetical protein [Escherichia coli]KAA1836661.1 hypothetical protein EA250_17895 [Escherichia coli]KJH02622.1 hypothetical protein TS82_10390 [Escherichia coli]MHQ16977.1 hypothetical protein [Escherichia coli]
MGPPASSNFYTREIKKYFTLVGMMLIWEASITPPFGTMQICIEKGMPDTIPSPDKITPINSSATSRKSERTRYAVMLVGYSFLRRL